MQLCKAFFLLLLTTCTLSTPVHNKRYLSRLNYVHHKFRRVAPIPSPSQIPSSLHIFSKQTALAARSAAERKYQRAPALLAGQGVQPGYAIPSSLRNTYDRASDQATNIAMLTSPHFRPIVDTDNHATVGTTFAGAGVLAVANSSVIDPLTDEILGNEDLEYYGLLKFGSQGQELQIDFDTGSADVWVPSNCGNCELLPQFQASESTTYRNTGKIFNVTYGYGEVNGTVAVDTVSIGSFNVTNQYFGAVDSVSENFAESPNSGLAGLAFSSISKTRAPTFAENLISQGFLRAPFFSFFLARGQQEGSEICFGGVDKSKTIGTAVLWVPVVSQTWWTVNMPSVTVGGSGITIGNLYTIVDTGTSFIYVPSKLATSIYNLIPGSAPASEYGPGYYSYPCNTLINISFTLGNQTLPLDPRDFSLGINESDPSGKTCIGAIVSAGLFTFAILGDSFLKSYVSVYDYSHGVRVGFVESIN